MKNMILIAVLGLQLFAGAQAAATYVACENCSEARYRTVAKQSVPSAPGINRHEVYVVDFATKHLRRFRITVVNEPDAYYKHLRQLVPVASELLHFEEYLVARSSVLGELASFDFTIEVPPGHFVGSAYDLWGSRRNQLLVQEYINSELSFLETALGNLFAYSYFLLDRKASKFYLKVTFPDSSSALFVLDGKMENLVWAYAVSESIDHDGNLIPDELSDFDEYSGLFNAESVQDFLLRAAIYGIPISDMRSGGGRTAVVCVHGASGGYWCEASSAD